MSFRDILSPGHEFPYNLHVHSVSSILPLGSIGPTGPTGPISDVPGPTGPSQSLSNYNSSSNGFLSLEGTGFFELLSVTVASTGTYFVFFSTSIVSTNPPSDVTSIFISVGSTGGLVLDSNRFLSGSNSDAYLPISTSCITSVDAGQSIFVVAQNYSFIASSVFDRSLNVIKIS